MADETVVVGCRLPHGLILEVGYTVTEKGVDGKPYVALRRPHGQYRTHTLKGTAENLIQRHGSQAIALPALLRPEPFLNENVPKDIWDRWVKQRPDHPFLKDGSLFSAPDLASAKAMSLDIVSDRQRARPVLAPLDPSGTTRVGDGLVQKAKFDEDAA